MHTAQQVLKICTFMSAKSPYVVDKTSNPFDDDDDESKMSTDDVNYEMPYTCDDGFWHDTALEILRRANFQELKSQQQQELSKFVHVIANRVFRLFTYMGQPVDFIKKLIVRYEYDASNHKVAHGDDYHVIMRFEKNKLLIFVCVSDRDRPLNCDPCPKERALGRKDDDDDKDALDVTANSPKVTYNAGPMQRETLQQRKDRVANSEAGALAAKMRQMEEERRGRPNARARRPHLAPLPQRPAAERQRSAPGRTQLEI